MGQSPLPGSEAEAVGSELRAASSKPLAKPANNIVINLIFKSFLVPFFLRIIIFLYV
jgi:hypothetical protein